MDVCFNQKKKCPRIVGHRGLPWNFPENTMISYQGAIDAGADFVELDFYSTRDGELVCIHDSKLDRYLAGTHEEMKGKPISAFSLKELQQVDFGQWKQPRFAGTRVGLLREVILLFMQPMEGQPTLVIEHKEGSVEQLLEILDAFKARKRVVVQSFHWDFLRQMRAKAPEITLVALGSKPLTSELIEEMQAMGVVGAHWNEHLTMKDVRALHDAGLAVWVYTLNSELAFRGATLLGFDGITTDRCDLAKCLLHGQKYD